jgi:small GTP-binding protein
VSLPEAAKISKKICMLGTFGVGKTSLVQQFVYQKFDERYLSTIGVKISHKAIEAVKEQKTGRWVQLNLILWDLAHLEKFDTVVKSYFHGAHAAVVVYDLTRPHTYREYEAMTKPFFDENPNAGVVLVGNKSDASGSQEPRKQIEEAAEALGCAYFFTSAKTGENVERTFLALAETLL